MRILNHRILGCLCLMSIQFGVGQCKVVAQIPKTILIQGTVHTDSDGAIIGSHQYEVRFFDQSTSGTQLGTGVGGATAFSNQGRFRISLVPPNQAIEQEDVWFELYLDTDDDGIEVEDLFNERIKLESVPSALKAGRSYSMDWGGLMNLPAGFADGIDNVGLPSFYNVKDFGATGNGAADDTAAIQAAIDVARVQGGTVCLPPGTYSVRSLDLTNITHGMGFVGSGINMTRLMPNTDDVNVLDLTGSVFVELRNFQLGAFNQVQAPKTAVLSAQSVVGGGRSNALHFESLYITGKYSVATFYCYGVPSSDMLNCDWYNYQPDDPDATVVSFTFDNYANVQSEFTNIATSGGNTSDWTLTACEIHDLSSQTGIPNSVMTALRLHDTMQMRWIGGNISGEGPQLIRITGSNLNEKITFVGTTLYSELGSPAGMVFNVDSRVSGLSVMECWNQAANTVFGGSAGAVFDEITFHSRPTTGTTSPTHVFDVPNGVLRNSLIHCNQLELRLGTIEASNLLINPGAITAGTNLATTIP